MSLYKRLIPLIFLLLFPTPVLAATSPDINNDHVVNIFDYNIVVSKFNNPYTIFDYNTLVANFGKTYGNNNKINVGAIYFSGSPGETTHQRNEIEGLIAFPQFKQAWPYFTIVRSDTTIDVHEDDQRVMDQEITLAATAGLDYFAFLGEGYGLKNYMNSPNKNKIKFAFMGGPNVIIEGAAVDTMIRYVQDPQYLSVTADNRPVFYVYSPDEYINTVKTAAAKAGFQNFTNKVKASTGKTPLLVAIQTNLEASTLKAAGFEDISFYLIGVTQKNMSYADYTKTVVGLWNRVRDEGKASNLDVIPIVGIGYDPRPKGINPIYHAFGTDPAWVQQGTPTEIAAHLKSALDWIKANPTETHAKTILIYAWNEFAEGGWLTPTVAGNLYNQRLNQMSTLLGGTTMATPRSPYTDNPPPPHPIGIAKIIAPVSGTTISGNKITVEGTAPNATRITIQIGNQKIFLIPGKTGSRDAVPFSIELPKPPPGRYDLKLTSPDTNTITISNLTIR